jgi:FemAB-related protein (PEP-CTERM system-associated)
MSIRSFTPADQARWDAYVDRMPTSHAYHRAGWAAVIRDGLGQRPRYLLSENRSGDIDGVLPLVSMRSRLFGHFLVSLPFLNYGGPCADNAEIARNLVDAAVDLAREEGAQHLELRLTEDSGFDLRVKASKVAMRLPLPDTSDALWKALGSKLRNQVGKPIKEGLVAKVGGLEELESFYHVFAINMRDLGTPVYSRRFFERTLREFPDNARICTVYHGDQPVAGGFLMGYKDTLEIPWASSLRSVSRLAPNMLLYWRSLQYACEAGYRVFDFGRSSPDAGTYKFKEQWGAKPVPLFWHYWMRDNAALPELNPTNPKYRMAIDLWKRLPVPITRIIGPHIVRNIP